MRKLFRFTIIPNDQGLRIDQCIASRVEELTRGEARKLLDIGAVHVDHKRTRKASTSVNEGQQVEVHVDGLGYDPFRIQDSHVLFQDAYMIALNKPSGVETQPTPGRYKGTLYEALLVHLKRDTRFGRKAEIGMIQRLDRDTSGVILFTTHQRSHGPISHQFSQRQAQKRYYALVEGLMDAEQGEFRSMLAKVRKTNRVQSVERGGKDAITRYRVLQRMDNASLVEVELLTGRSHQIRAHFSEAGHPLIGDVKYGASLSVPGMITSRHMLHSRLLTISHPIDKSTLTIEAPLPDDFMSTLKALGGDFHPRLETDAPC